MTTIEAPLSDQVLTPSEAAELLEISEPELLAAAARRAIPGVCLGGVWRFSLAKITRQRNMGLQVHALAAAHL
ncbi:hypothetical protein REH65_33180 (plasmid) [Saccharopolyspora sp. ID03-671]|uniref:helix-turn-helix domain-containing protein n=1 Tax=Saccharopolyspora sp. ID03-671 TaxID=3073066 RepID=UPI0030F49FCB